MGKVVCVRIPDEEVWASFQAFVAFKYGKTKGVLGREVCYALQKYLESEQTRTHINNNRSNDRRPKVGSRTMKSLKAIAREIMSNYPKEVPENEVERIITEVAGGEIRTLRRYKNLLRNYGILEPDRVIRLTNPPKFIFKVNRSEANKFRRIL